MNMRIGTLRAAAVATSAVALMTLAAGCTVAVTRLPAAPAPNVAAPATPPVSTQAAPAALLSPALSVGAPGVVRAGVRFTVTGTAHGTDAAEPVQLVLQRLSGSGWSAVSTTSAAVRAAGTFSASLKASARGRWRVIAVSLETTTHARAASPPAPVRAVGTKVIALTFDDGPWRSSTDTILSILKRNDVRATFFMLGAQVNGQRSRVRRVAAAGNLIGVHSWNHPVMVRRSSSTNYADLKKCKAVERAASGVVPRWFRPPYGSTDRALAATARRLGLRQVIWTVDTLDWKYRNAGSISSRAIAGARTGGVVLMHDGGGPRAATAAALPIIIRTLRARGYDFATLDELVALGYRVR
jgi:peptidoglycan-N-acetylglucosamine deacetylase